MINDNTDKNKNHKVTTKSNMNGTAITIKYIEKMSIMQWDAIFNEAFHKLLTDIVNCLHKEVERPVDYCYATRDSTIY